MCKIALLENYSFFGSGIKALVESIANCTIIIESESVDDLLLEIHKNRPDLIIVDVLHCEKDGIAPLQKIKKNFNSIPVLIIISMEYSDCLEDYITLGVKGIIFKDAGPDQLSNALETLKSGKDYFPEKVWELLKDVLRSRKSLKISSEDKPLLTKREITVLKEVCKGLTFKEIGKNLNISPRTVETHKKNIATKLELKTTAEIIRYAMENNLN